MSSVKLLTGLLDGITRIREISETRPAGLKRHPSHETTKKKTAPHICLLQQIHGAIIYRGYQFKKIPTVIMQESITMRSGIYIMYHDTAYHDADHGYEEIL